MTEEPPSPEAAAEAALAKLPVLGPVVWLLARAEDRRHLFVTDVETRFLPPVMLEQCRLVMRGTMPVAFVSWARVSDAVSARLQGGVNQVAPHEWQGGPHLWVVDVVAPFGGAEEILAEIHRESFPSEPHLRYLAFDPATGGNTVRTVAAVTPPLM